MSSEVEWSAAACGWIELRYVGRHSCSATLIDQSFTRTMNFYFSLLCGWYCGVQKGCVDGGF